MADRIESMFRVDGLCALVTGASSGLGRRFALTLARAGAGEVVVAGRRVESLAGLVDEICALGCRGRGVKLGTSPAPKASPRASTAPAARVPSSPTS